jgi:hypothetical protein
MSLKYCLTTILVLCLSVPGLIHATEAEAEAVAKESSAEELEKVLSQTLDDSEYVDEKRCLRSHEYNKVEIINSGHLVFKGRKNRIWLNTLRNNCSGLRKGMAMQFEMHGRRVCRLDFFKGIRSFNDRHTPTATCTLGSFEQVTEEQLALLEESLAKEKESKVVRSTKRAAKAAKVNE